jgi:hypothetical protein
MDDKPLTGKEERLIRAIERVLAARSRRDQPGVKITNLASGVRQVEVHAYDDDVTVAGDAARAEFERQTGLVGVPAAELERLRWLASIGQVTLEKNGGEVPDEVEVRGPDPDFKDRLADDVAQAEARPWMRDIQAGPGRKRRSVAAVGDGDAEVRPTVEDTEAMIAKLREINDSGVEGVTVTDA